ncbi:hypothetical protein GCM10027176_62840 [Actinoallomurus bryophytorum]|uniref:Transglycosylase-like protein with SLT domain n=1 Tax=Actinoallomurus bryophytorum TaxID=1490222 RepID=A0A543CFL4_9ACTN|nr:lytic transglycosylase domain-containing protein [Actinoallomurus bryophytorum]TQL95790.1 hypothetical protein FB559_1300 [Actinoallomurus bryophytorum]
MPTDDIKVAGTPNIAQPGGPYAPGGQETGAYDTYETTARDAASYDVGGPGPGPQDAGATAAYDLGAAPEPGPAYGAGGPYGAGPYDADPYGMGATSAMPPADGVDPSAPLDFEDIRRKPHTSNKRLIRFAAVAAAVAVVGGGGVAWAVTGSGSSSDKTDASRPLQAQVQAPAPLTDAQRKDAEDKRQKLLKKVASRAARDQVSRPKLMSKGTPPPTKKPSPPGAGNPVPASEAQRIAKSLLSSYGWPSSQFGCVVSLFNRESGWNVHASNPSGAYGIPQAKPGSKMASAGPDWQDNATTQIKWGYGYIKDRYSTPCGAWAHSQSTGWY